MTYDIPVKVCPECSEHFPEGYEFEYVNPRDEWVCQECAAGLWGTDEPNSDMPYSGSMERKI